MDTRTAFAVLGLPPGSAPAAIRDAYRDLAKVWHPDRFAGDSRLQAKASDKMRELNEAYRLAAAVGSGPGAARGASSPRAEPADTPAGRRPATGGTSGPSSAGPFLPFDTLWRTIFFAGVCGLVLAIFTAPAGFFALEPGRPVPRPSRSGTAGAITYTRLPESEMGEATLVSRVRGTWVVAEHERTTWLLAGTRLDLQRGTLSCAPPARCDASFRPNGASRLSLRGATAEDAHDVDVLFASPTVMLWLVHPAGDRVATPARIVLEAQGDGPATGVGP